MSLKNDELSNLSIEEFLELSGEDVQQFDFTIAPAGIYTGTINIEHEAKEITGVDAPQLMLSVKLTGLSVVEFMEGEAGESPEELDVEKDCPESIKYTYILPMKGQQFVTDFYDVACELAGKEEVTNKEIIENLDGAVVEFTNSYYRTVGKAGTAKEGQNLLYTNIRNISVVSV